MANFQLFLNTNITSRLVGRRLLRSAADGRRAGWFRALTADRRALSSDCRSAHFDRDRAEPTRLAAAVACNPGDRRRSDYQQGTYTVFRGQQAAATTHPKRNRVGWYSDRSSGHEQYPHVPHHEHSCERAGAGVSTSLVPTQIIAFLSISASQSLALNNPQQAVAFVQPGLQFDVRNCNGAALRRSLPAHFVQCGAAV